MEVSDIVLLLIVAVSTGIGVVKGFVREFVSVVALIGGLVLAFYFSSTPAQWISNTQWDFFGQVIDSHDVSFVVSFIIIVIATMIVGRILGAGISRMVVVGGIGNIDRFLGLVFGVVRGGIMITLLVIIAGLTKLPSSNTWEKSQLLPLFETAAYYVVDKLPAGYSKHFSFPSIPNQPDDGGI